MDNDFFGGLGGLMKGLSGFMPQDDPNVKIMNATTTLADLEKQMQSVYAQAGKKALESNPQGFEPERAELQGLQLQYNKAKTALEQAQAAKKAEEEAAEIAKESRTCPSCGEINPEGVKFCQECGAKLGVPAKAACSKCGFQNDPGTKFCGECGNRL